MQAPVAGRLHQDRRVTTFRDPMVFALSLAGFLAFRSALASPGSDPRFLPGPREVMQATRHEAAVGALWTHVGARLLRVSAAVVLATQSLARPNPRVCYARRLRRLSASPATPNAPISRGSVAGSGIGAGCTRSKVSAGFL